MWGWYDRYVGMDPLTIGLRELLDALEVSDRDLRSVIRDRPKGGVGAPQRRSTRNGSFFSKPERTVTHRAPRTARSGSSGSPAAVRPDTASKLAIGLHQYIKSDRPVGFYDTETEGSDFVEPMFHEAGIELVPYKSRSFDNLMAFTRDCEREGAVILLADSISHVWKEVIAAYLASRQTTFLGMNDWGFLKPKWEEFTTLFLKSRLHYFLLGRAAWEYENTIDEDSGKKGIEKVGTKMAAETNMGYEPSLLLEMVREKEVRAAGGSMWRHDCYVLKDRTDTINGKVFANPDFDMILPFIKRLNLGGEHRVLDESQTQFAPQDWSYSNRKKAQTIAAEELQGVLISAFPSQSAKEKKIRLDILQVVFGARSWTAVESMAPDTLREGIAVVQALCPIIIKADDIEDGDLVGWLEGHVQDIRVQHELDGQKPDGDPEDDIPEFPDPAAETGPGGGGSRRPRPGYPFNTN